MLFNETQWQINTLPFYVDEYAIYTMQSKLGCDFQIIILI